jgi:hypothetical protein
MPPNMPQATHIRPMELGDILDGAFKIYRARFVPLFLSALLPYLPMVISGGFFAVALGTGASSAAAAGGIAMLISVPLMLIGFVIATGSITYIVSEAYQGRSADLGDGMRRALARGLPVTGTVVLSLLAIGVGLVLCIVPGVILGMMFFAAVPVVVLEGRGPIEAMQRSSDLSKGALGQIFVVLLVAGLISALPGYGVSFLSMAATYAKPSPALDVVSAVLRLLMNAVLAPFSSAAAVLLYYDRRIRTEAFDVQLAAEQLGAEPGV